MAQDAMAVAISTYNYLRPHNSINNLKPAEAHQLTGAIPKKWKSYYKPKKVEEPMEMVTPC